MELLQLKYFFDSAKTESFAKTAEKYMVPASSVSASIKRLEQDLDCKLFDRTCNRVILNDNGKRLQQALCVVFDELEQATDALSHQVIDDRHINLLVTAIRGRITDYIIEFNEKFPSIKFNTVFRFEEDPEKYDIIIDIADNKINTPIMSSLTFVPSGSFSGRRPITPYRDGP
ncbi:MAG: LysR family transcriptional regulator [Clostridia bacterium]|nr:LysR family transcriptional regulator [Clostridia bacterium]